MATATKTKKWSGAAALIIDGLKKDQTDKQIKARVRSSFPQYKCLNKTIAWGRKHPEWVAGRYVPASHSKNGKKAEAKKITKKPTAKKTPAKKKPAAAKKAVKKAA